MIESELIQARGIGDVESTILRSRSQEDQPGADGVMGEG